MESHEVMRRAINNMGVKHIASEMSLSTSLIYKWCQPKDGPESPGADNPLDRLARVFELTQETEPIQWLCQKANGFFVRNPAPQGQLPRPLSAAQEILQEFSDLLNVVAKSIENDQVIDRTEAQRIREEWERLKSATETFVFACENGSYGTKQEEKSTK